RDDGVRGLQDLVVDAIDDGGVDVLAAGRRDDDLFRAALEVGGGLFLGGEQAGAFQHHVDPQVAPGQLGGITLGQHTDAVAVDHRGIAIGLDGAGDAAVGGVVAREVGVGLGVAQVVDRHDLEVVLLAVLVVGPKDIAANAAIAIDRHAYGHDGSPVYFTKAARPWPQDARPSG